MTLSLGMIGNLQHSRTRRGFRPSNYRRWCTAIEVVKRTNIGELREERIQSRTYIQGMPRTYTVTTCGKSRAIRTTRIRTGEKCH
jgi:hypothetical protein